MKKVTAIIGSQRKGVTYKALQEFEKNLKQLGEVDFEYVFLHDYQLEFCRGCKLCFDKGESYCPIKDDRDKLLEKLEQSDGVVFATPSYGFQISGRMKNMIDRISFVFHRPRFFGKTFIGLVIHAVPVYAGKIQRYLDFVGSGLGFNVVKGCHIRSMEPISAQEQEKLEKTTKEAAKRFYNKLVQPKLPAPSIFRLMAFRMTRSGLQVNKERYYDYYYYQDKGWFKADYYYEAFLGPLKRLAGNLFDFLGCQLFKSR